MIDIRCFPDCFREPTEPRPESDPGTSRPPALERVVGPDRARSAPANYRVAPACTARSSGRRGFAPAVELLQPAPERAAELGLKAPLLLRPRRPRRTSAEFPRAG